MDLRAVRLQLDTAAQTLTVALTIRETGAKGDEAAKQAAWVWADTDDDARADLVVRFERQATGDALVTAERVTGSTAGCQPRTGGELLAQQLVAPTQTDGPLTFTATVAGVKAENGLTWAAFGATQGAQLGFDYVPDAVNPDLAIANPADRSCELPGDDVGWSVLLMAGPLLPEGLVSTGFADFLGAAHGDSPLGAASVVAFRVPRADNQPPRAVVAVRPRRPGAGERVVLDAGRSQDDRGRIASVRWDLDGDGSFTDAYGARVQLSLATSGRTPLAVEVMDSEGMPSRARVVVAVRARRALPVAALAARRPLAARTRVTFDRTLEGWRRLGGAFGRRPEPGPTIPLERELNLEARVGGSYGDTRIPLGARGRGWVSSYRPVRGGAGLTAATRASLAAGVLLSPRLRASGRFLSYRIGGDAALTPARRPAVRVEVWARRGNGRFRRVNRATRAPNELEQMRRVDINLGSVARPGTEIVVAVIDESSFAHINFDDVRIDRKRLPIERPPPIAGFFDSHEHVMAHQAFGGLGLGIRMYMGVPGRSLAEGLDPTGYAQDVARDDDAHFGGPVARLILNIVERRRSDAGLFTLIGSFTGSEFHDTTLGPAHEQYHVTELRRAHEGGLRIISSLAVNNPAIEYAMGYPRNRDGGPPCVQLDSRPCEDDRGAVNRIGPLSTDTAVLEAHVAAWRQLERANAEWLQIVYSPDQMYDAIANGKLAVVLGTEVETLGGLGFSTAADEVDYLWRLGYRQVQLIHAVDNALGGAGLFQDAYATTNDFVHRPVRDANRERVVRDVAAQGLALDAPAGSRLNFGYLFRTDRYGCRRGFEATPTAVSRGECIDWAFNVRQSLVSLDSFGLPLLVTVHPAAAEVFVGRYAPAATDLQGQRNAQGLSPLGHEYVRALIRRGMLIDVEHASDHAFEALVNPGPGAGKGPVWDALPGPGCSLAEPETAPCWPRAYPLMSSHTSFRAQSLASVNFACLGPEGGSQFRELDLGELQRLGCRTAEKGWVAREFERSVRQIEFIRRSGGTIAPVAGQDPIDSVLDQRAPAEAGLDWRLVPGRDRLPRRVPANNCAGSSRGWAHAYLYGLAKMRGVGVGLSTDMPMVGSAVPRYGERACGASAGARRPDIEEALQPEQFDRRAQQPGERIAYGRADAPALSGPAMRPLVPPGQAARDFNEIGLRSIGMLPDLIQDGRNIGIDARDLGPLFASAQHFIDMWNKAYRVTGCDVGVSTPRETYARCEGDGLAALDEAAVCRRTCPDDEGRGLARRPGGVPFRFKAPFDDGAGRRGWPETPFD